MDAPASPRTLLVDCLTSLQPMGIAVAQIISYGAVNAAELALTDALLALGVALLSTFAIWLAIWKFIAKARPAALITSLIAFSFWAYARVLDAASGMIADAGAASDIRFALGLLLAWGAALLLATIWIRRTKQSLSGLYAIMDAVALIGVVLPLAALMNQLETGRTIQQESGRVPSVGTASMRHPSLDPATPSQAGLPSIFLIVLDAYGRDDELTEHFGIRNGLGARLEEVGFYVAKESRANYTSTLQALPSLLNFDYVQNFIDPRRKGRAQYQELLQRNRFLEKIRAKGYRFISYETGIKLTEFRHADEYVLAPTPLEVLGFSFKPNYFERGLLGLTPAGPFLRHSKSLSPYTLHRSRVLHALKDLPRHASGSSPVFALAHILSPHEPFVFGRDGQDVSPRALPYALKSIFEDPNLPAEPGEVGPEYARRYADQAQYVADLVIETVESILKQSATPPVIIIQGDHGPYGFSPNVRRSRLPILNAYYMPGDGSTRLYPSISPVNSMRVVLNEYLGENMPLLRDRSFYSNWSKPFTFVEQQ